MPDTFEQDVAAALNDMARQFFGTTAKWGGVTTGAYFAPRIAAAIQAAATDMTAPPWAIAMRCQAGLAALRGETP